MASVYDDVTPAWLKDTFLLGVDLTLDKGEPYPDTIYTSAIASAVQWIEHELGIILDPMPIVDERHDARLEDHDAWWPFSLDHRPLVSVDGMALQFGTYPRVTFPKSWIVPVAETQSRINLMPSGDSIGSFMFRNGVPLVLGDVFQPMPSVPGYFVFDYTAGFAQYEGTASIADGVATKTVTLPGTMPRGTYRVIATVAGNGAAGVTVTAKTSAAFTVALTTPPSGGAATLTWRVSAIPADLLQAIGYKASLLPLDIAGDLIAGAGVANKSASLDGLSASVGTTSSATNSGYGARVLQFERELKGLLPALRARYRAVNFGAL